MDFDRTDIADAAQQLVKVYRQAQEYRAAWESVERNTKNAIRELREYLGGNPVEAGTEALPALGTSTIFVANAYQSADAIRTFARPEAWPAALDDIAIVINNAYRERNRKAQ